MDHKPITVKNLPVVCYYFLYALGLVVLFISFIESDIIMTLLLFGFSLFTIIHSSYELCSYWTRHYGELIISKSSIVTIFLGYMLFVVGNLKVGINIALIINGVVQIFDVCLSILVVLLASYGITRMYKDSSKTLITHIVEDIHESKSLRS